MGWGTLQRLLGRVIVACAIAFVASASPSVAQTNPQVFRDCNNCPEMVVVPAGSFNIGSPVSETGRLGDESPRRRVSIGQFAVSKFEVTRSEWADFVQATNRADPQVSGDSCIWRSPSFAQDGNHPVVCVNLEDALDYIAWLNQRTGQRYRLLTEAEWEYAARAGTDTPYPWGYTASRKHANYGGDWEREGLASGPDQWVNTSPGGSFPANAFGLFDMHGNVWEWVQDCYVDSYSRLPTDGLASKTNCSARVIRGGSWGSHARFLRSAHRLWTYSGRGNTVGFRVARTHN